MRNADNPVLVTVSRSGITESAHRGAFAVAARDGAILQAAGDVVRAVFPRSAVKAFQCLPVIESGAADQFGFDAREIALCCSSHDGEDAHVAVARGMLAKAGNSESHYECGAHWPVDRASQLELARAGEEPRAVHNNCSGKHAGMLALARRLGVATQGYIAADHPVQRAIARRMGEICGIDIDRQPLGIDGCSVPTWAMPLTHLAQGFARLTDPALAAGRRIIASAREHPLMIGGAASFDSRLMSALPRVFVKTGAEGVYAALVPHAGIGIALKCDDGAHRASSAAIAAVLAGLDVWTQEERAILRKFAETRLQNWMGREVGSVSAVI